MEKNNSDQTSSYSWWWDSHNRPHQSQWLHLTLSELDEKIKMILTLIEEEGDTFAKRAEMYYKKRPELIKMVQDLHRSYRALADKYDHLRSESIRGINYFGSSSSSSIIELQHLENNQNQEAPISHSEPKKSSVEPLNSQIGDESMPTEKWKSDVIKFGFRMESLEREKMWNELRLNVSKLIEDNLEQQGELIRRNEEKREVIKDQSVHIEKLMNENRDLKASLAMARSKFVDTKKNENKSQISRMKGIILGKFARSGASTGFYGS